MFHTLKKEKFVQRKGRTSNIISKYNKAYISIVLLLCFGVSIFSKDIMLLLPSKEYQSAHLYVPIIAVAHMFALIGGITDKGFEQSKKMKANMIISILAAVLNLILNYLLIPKYKVFGAAIATALSFFICFFISYIYIKLNCFFVAIPWGKVVPMLLVFTLTFLLFNIGFWDDKILISIISKIIISAILTIFIFHSNYKLLTQIKSTT